jgi:hypothetical protein
MDTIVYALRDFFEFLFQFMPSIGAMFNITASAVISFFMIYWIVQMFKNPDKARN